MIQFERLRINGFKSFVDRTELDIGPGLNGIVGPNGCGKSNLVEALRWVMGESSAKRMRGGGMEDVIFSGTEKRSARNIAEVSLLLNNESRDAPAAYNGSDEVEVVRRIERDRGSNYKINGKNVRARDVQMLFADTVTGANSPALVSQGRVTQIINSKPLERRLILEESAGITGLYARRHEAELRLKAADTNLVRVEDVLVNMEQRLNALKRQSRQATRYRNVSAQIRQIEVLIAWLEWSGIHARIEEKQRVFDEAEKLVEENLLIVTGLTKTQNTQAQDLPELRKIETEAAARLQTLRLTLQRIEDDYERYKQDLIETKDQLEETVKDHAHEEQMVAESSQVLERLEEEQASIINDQGNEEDILQEKQALKEELEKKVLKLEETYTAHMQSVAEIKARKQSLEQQLEQNRSRLNVASERKTKAEAEYQDVLKQKPEGNQKADFESKINGLSANIKALDEKLAKARAKTEALKSNLQEKRETLRAAENAHAEFQAELNMLENLLEQGDVEFTPVLDKLTAKSGLETALSRALGDTLMASLEEGAPSRWISRKSMDLPALPDGLSPLLNFVDAPSELHLALSQIGYVDADHVSQSFVDQLSPGQSIVSRSGSYWRWDGYFVEESAKDRNAQILEQKNKLKSLKAQKQKFENTVTKAETALSDTLTKQREQDEAIEALQKSLQIKREELGEANRSLSQYIETYARQESEEKRLQDTIKMATEDIGTLQEVIGWDEERLKSYDSEEQSSKEQNIETLKAELEEARSAYQEAVRAFDMYQQEQNSRKARMHAIADERINIQNRLIRSKERIKQLKERKEGLKEKVEALQAQPSNFEQEKQDLLGKISAAETARSEAAEKLATCEGEVDETSKALKQAEQKLSELRESRAGAQATLASLKEQTEQLSADIEEKFKMKPEQLKEHAAIDMEKNTDSVESFREKKEKLIRERDNIGPVNLRADEEAQELEKEVTTMLNERNDLMQAIEELRGGINKINKEARERLTLAFEHVNAHFQRLFTKLFAGGKAHLALVDGEDPLDAGLEIFAQPPGKTLQSLSLLSGGEQTLASIALIFAMFLTNPSPICVLDEIDAPLDDANVDRVCDLLEEISERGDTRFLIITHHRMTMARMDRLYGVTMSEKGISQLVSVDLQQSFAFLDEAA